MAPTTNFGARAHFPLSTFGSACLVAFAVTGCPSTATTSTEPVITGVEILASSIVAGHGCGKETKTQVYRYAAVVYHARASDPSLPEDGPIASNLFECYADGILSNLPLSDAGSANYVVTVYAFSYASFQQTPAVAGLQCPAGSPPPCPAETPSNVAQPTVAAAADFTLTCTAMQEQGVPVLARCPATGQIATSSNDASEVEAGVDATADAASNDATADDGGPLHP